MASPFSKNIHVNYIFTRKYTEFEMFWNLLNILLVHWHRQSSQDASIPHNYWFHNRKMLQNNLKIVRKGKCILKEQPFVYVLKSKYRKERCDYCFKSGASWVLFFFTFFCDDYKTDVLYFKLRFCYLFTAEKCSSVLAVNMFTIVIVTAKQVRGLFIRRNVCV